MKIHYTARALRDIDQLQAYVSKHSSSGSRNIRRRIRGLLEFLKRNPLAGQQTDVSGLRRIVATPYPYIIFYRPSTTQILVIAVQHGARDPASAPDAET